MKAYPVLN